MDAPNPLADDRSPAERRHDEARRQSELVIRQADAATRRILAGVPAWETLVGMRKEPGHAAGGW